MAKVSTKRCDLADVTVKRILATLLAEFKERGLGRSDLHNGYQGMTPQNLELRCCGQDLSSKVDFDLAIDDLEYDDLISTGPRVPYENEPYSSVYIVGLRSKREYTYLTEDGYKAATKMPTLREKHNTDTSHVHISGGNFYHSPIGIGERVTQRVSVNASGSDEIFEQIRAITINQVSDDASREQILARLDELESPRNERTLMERYQGFISVVGDHITVYGPLLTILLQRLTQTPSQ